MFRAIALGIETNTDWIATALTADDKLRMPEIGTEDPVAELHDDVAFSRLREAAEKIGQPGKA